jgi:hypothetical protein
VIQVGTDIADYKCSWLIVQAMELVNENEMKILYVRKLSIEFAHTIPLMTPPHLHNFSCIHLIDLSGELRQI